MQELLRAIFHLLSMVLSSFIFWRLFHLVKPPIDSEIEFILCLLIFYLWQAHLIYTLVFVLFYQSINEYEWEMLSCVALGFVLGAASGFAVAGLGGFLFCSILGPHFGAFVCWAVRKVKSNQFDS
jgi:hypothetical protein